MIRRKKQKIKSSNKIKELPTQAYQTTVSSDFGIAPDEKLIDMIQAYQLHPWVYACVSRISSDFSQIDYEIYYEKNKEWLIDEKHPFRQLLARPNVYMTKNDIMEYSSISLEMTGNSYWAFVRDQKTGLPSEIWILPPHLIKAVSTKEKFVDYYIYDVDGQSVRFEYNDIIHFQFANLDDFRYGQGSVLASRTEITTDLFSSAWNKNFFKNSARPDSILETEKVLDDAVRKRTLEGWKKMHRGVKNAHKVALLEAGTKFKDVGVKHTDMQFVEGKRQARETILATFKVPPGLIGIMEYANYANMKPQEQIYWKNTMLPKIRKFASTLTLRVGQIYYKPMSLIQALTEQIEALRPDLNMLADIGLKFNKMGIPVNDIIRKLDLPFDEIEGGDEPFTYVESPNQENPTTLSMRKQKFLESENQKEIEAKKKKSLETLIKWKSFDSRMREKEFEFKSILRGYFRAQRRRVKANLVKNIDRLFAGRIADKSVVGKVKDLIGLKKENISISVDLLFNEEEEISLMEKIIENPIKESFVDGANRTGKKIDRTFDFNLQNPKAIDFINSKIMNISRKCNNSTKETLDKKVVDAIEEAIQNGYSQSDTIKEISDRIDDVYDFAVEGRSERIARTEVISANNAGSHAAMEQTGVQKKEWLSTKDDKTRDTHLELDGEVVGITEKFVVGTDSGDTHILDYPGDPDADASEIVNCRCTIIPVVED